MVDRAGNIVLEQQLFACAVIILGDCLRGGRFAGMRREAFRRYEILKKYGLCGSVHLCLWQHWATPTVAKVATPLKTE